MAAIALALGWGLMPGKASAGDMSSVPSDYCIQLAEQFDQNLSTASPSRFLAEARVRRENGWAQCSAGKVGQGENTLKGAIRDLGGTPEPRSLRPLL